MARKSGKASRRRATRAHQKDDWIDSSKTLVRKKRFCGSYMMDTNGGATYEDLLRPGRAAEPPIRARKASAHDVVETGAETVGFQNVLGGVGALQIITDTSLIPTRSIGLLKILLKSGELRYGTAWLIGPRTLATAAHNLLSPEAGEADTLEVGMAYDGKLAHGGWHRIVDCKFNKGWRKWLDPRKGYDYAVLKIKDSAVGKKLRWFGFADYKDAKFDNMLVNIFGYPMDRERFQQFHMYGVSGRVLAVNSRLIHYNCATDDGMSGGPVIARFGEQRIVVGIHVAGGTHSNVGTRINDAAYALFNKYRNW